jgi:hypothetical protein
LDIYDIGYDSVDETFLQPESNPNILPRDLQSKLQYIDSLSQEELEVEIKAIPSVAKELLLHFRRLLPVSLAMNDMVRNCKEQALANKKFMEFRSCITEDAWNLFFESLENRLSDIPNPTHIDSAIFLVEVDDCFVELDKRYTRVTVDMLSKLIKRFRSLAKAASDMSYSSKCRQYRICCIDMDDAWGRIRDKVLNQIKASRQAFRQRFNTFPEIVFNKFIDDLFLSNSSSDEYG